MSDYQPGDRIPARWDGGSFWLPGTVVRFDDGIRDGKGERPLPQRLIR